MSKMSPFQAYNTITLGVNGTAMIGFNTLTNKEVWDLAFYVKSLRFKKQPIDSVLIKSLFNKVYFILKNHLLCRWSCSEGYAYICAYE
jgi:high-affinity iron transporter